MCNGDPPLADFATNLAENSMRPVALGRKNWLHIGSPQAGPKVAAILSVVETCRRLKVPVREYLKGVQNGEATQLPSSSALRTPKAGVTVIGNSGRSNSETNPAGERTKLSYRRAGLAIAVSLRPGIGCFLSTVYFP
jgi:hypothetical protein